MIVKRELAGKFIRISFKMSSVFKKHFSLCQKWPLNTDMTELPVSIKVVLPSKINLNEQFLQVITLISSSAPK
jgi:hypothetical protein